MMSTTDTIDVAGPDRRLRRVAVFVLAAAMIPLCAYVCDSSFTRYMADDYCVAAALHAQGFLASQASLFKSLSGRFSWNFVMNAVELLGPAIVPVLPVLTLATWIVAIVWMIGRWRFAVSLIESRVVRLALAAVVLYVTLRITPNVVQSLYWQSNMLTVTVPLVLLTIYAGLVGTWVNQPSAGPPSVLRVTMATGLPFVIAGFVEAIAALLVPALAIATIVAALRLRAPKYSSVVTLLAAGFAGSSLALGLMWFSPGTHNRLLLEGHKHISVLEWVRLSAYLAVRALLLSVRLGALSWPFAILSSASMGVAAASIEKCRRQASGTDKIKLMGLRTAFVGLPFMAFVVFFLCVSPAVYVFSSGPPARVLIIPAFLLTCFVMVWWFLGGYVVGRALLGPLPSPHLAAPTRRTLLIGALLVVLCGPIVTTAKILRFIPSDRAYSTAWDAQDRTLRRAVSDGDTVAWVVPLPTSYTDRARLGVLRADPNYWVNQCVAQYYGLRMVSVRLPPQPPAR